MALKKCNSRPEPPNDDLTPLWFLCLLAGATAMAMGLAVAGFRAP